MIDQSIQILQSLTWQHAVLVTVLSVALFIGSMALVIYFLAQLPADYFHTGFDTKTLPHHTPVVRWVGILFKNAVGIVLIVCGVIMAIPGVPGQGLLTMFVGLVLIDFPGKRTLELNLIARPRVLATINRLRSRFSKPPLTLK